MKTIHNQYVCRGNLPAPKHLTSQDHSKSLTWPATPATLLRPGQIATSHGSPMKLLFHVDSCRKTSSWIKPYWHPNNLKIESEITVLQEFSITYISSTPKPRESLKPLTWMARSRQVRLSSSASSSCCRSHFRMAWQLASLRGIS